MPWTAGAKLARVLGAVFGFFSDDSRRCSQVKLGSAADFLLDISETDLSTLTASIKAPSGRDEPCLLKRLPNNHIGELWTAYVVGRSRDLSLLSKPVSQVYASALVLTTLDTGLLPSKEVLLLILRLCPNVLAILSLL